MVVAAMKLKKGSSIHLKPKPLRAKQIGSCFGCFVTLRRAKVEAEAAANVQIVEQDRSVAPIYTECVLA
eukprot:scaffold83296_cov36-Prasinocladus_malaysianus.AAC.1